MEPDGFQLSEAHRILQGKFDLGQYDTTDHRITLIILRPRTIYMEIIVNIIKDERNKLKQQKLNEKIFKKNMVLFIFTCFSRKTFS